MNAKLQQSLPLPTAWIGLTPNPRGRFHYLAPPTIHFAIACASSSVRPGWGGIGTGPHTPSPPALIFFARYASLSGLPWYLAATSVKPGPTTLLVMPWHAVQAFFASSAFGSAAAGAAATATGAAFAAVALGS